jgi:tetratricopeptide (TPR) repeat protein
VWQYTRVGYKFSVAADQPRAKSLCVSQRSSLAKGETTMTSSCCRLPASLLLFAFFLAFFCARPGSVLAGDLDDCTGNIPEKVEPACSAIVNDPSRSSDDRLKAYVNRSRLFAGRSKLDLAAADAEAALQLNPQSVPALLARGYVRERTGNFDLALADMNRAIELDPKNAFAFVSRAILKNEQRAWAEALADSNQAIALRQDFAQAYVVRARTYVETAQLDQALSDLNTAISINSNVQNAFFWRGQVYRRKGDMDRAIDDFSRAIAQAPQADRASYLARGQIFSAKGDYPSAIADFDKVLAIAPDDRLAQQVRQSAIAMQTELAKVRNGQPAPTPVPKDVAVASPPQATVPPPALPANQSIEQAKQLLQQRRPAEAIARLNLALAADPHNEIALRFRAALLMASSRFAESRADMDEVLKLKPNDAQTWALRGLVSIGLKQTDQAMVDINHALGLDPNNATAYLGRGMIDRAAGKSQEAIADLDRSIALNPKDGTAFTERGQAHMSLKRFDKALADYDQALVLNPANDLARAARGLTLLIKGNSAEGLVDIKNALDRNPNNQLAQLGQGLAMVVSGQYDRAIVALNQLVGKNVAYDPFARVLRARAYLGQNDTASAMADLNLVLAARPNDLDALGLRGIAWLAMHENDKALDDLTRAIGQRETVESYFARAKIYEAQSKFDKATDDFRRATQLTASSVFDVLAQAASKQKIQQLSKQIPCGSSVRSPGNGTCL